MYKRQGVTEEQTDNTVTVASDSDVEAYSEIAEKVTAKVLAEIAAKGIDAEAAYEMIKSEMK